MMNLLPLVLAQMEAPMNDGGGGAGGLLLGGGCFVFAVILGIAGLIFWIWALVDAIRNPSLSDNERIVWVVVIVLTSWLGALIYLIMGRKGSGSRPIT
jgi:hypothetical protein